MAKVVQLVTGVSANPTRYSYRTMAPNCSIISE